MKFAVHASGIVAQDNDSLQCGLINLSVYRVIGIKDNENPDAYSYKFSPCKDITCAGKTNARVRIASLSFSLSLSLCFLCSFVYEQS